MRRLVVVVLVCLGLVVVLSGCGLLRDTATPSARLQGHWFSDDAIDYYFGPLDATTGQGSLIIVDADGVRTDLSYSIVEENDEESLLTLLYQGDEEREITFYIPEDGIFMQERQEGVDPEDAMDYTFIDTSIEPPEYEE